MDYSEAAAILGLEGKFGEGEIKKAYYKKALQFHPDKYKKDDGEQFRKIKEAYEKLLKAHNSDISSDDIELTYMDLIKKCLRHIMPEFKWDDMFLDSTLKTLLKDCKKVSISLFNKLSKEKALEVYVFLSKHMELLNLDKDFVDEMLSIIRKRSESDNIIILNPDINNLINDDIYKLTVNHKVFYVPLWHSEIVYDEEGADLIVRSIPDISSNITIDNYNNLHINITEDISYILDNEKLEFKIGKKVFEINQEKIRITKQQTLVLPNEGLLLSDHDNLYNTKKRAHIYVHLTLE